MYNTTCVVFKQNIYGNAKCSDVTTDIMGTNKTAMNRDIASLKHNGSTIKDKHQLPDIANEYFANVAISTSQKKFHL